MFDVVKFKGKFVEDRPYEEKLKMMQEISTKIPELELPPLAFTQQEKMKLKNDILSGKHPLTREGIVVYKMKEATPYKSKSNEDFDVLITGVFSASPGSKYEGNAIGGFVGIPENTKTKIRIGSGLSDELRREAYLNPNRFIGLWAKVTGHQQYQTGKLRVPIFKEFRYEKYK
jgi:ATP-dependent DNA ligase